MFILIIVLVNSIARVLEVLLKQKADKSEDSRAPLKNIS